MDNLVDFISTHKQVFFWTIQIVDDNFAGGEMIHTTIHKYIYSKEHK